MTSRLILVFILLQQVALANGISSTCKVEIHGTSADIVCNFSIDVSAVLNDFQVGHFPKQNMRRPETVFIMMKRTQGKTEYKIRPGYQLQGTVSRTVTLRIPKLSQEHAGQYMCAVIPSDPTEVQLCDLTFEAIPADVLVHRDVHNGISDESTVSSKNASIEGTKTLSPLVIGVSVASTLVFLAIVILSIIVYRRKTQKSARCKLDSISLYCTTSFI